jgi:hypothetical protein
MTMSPWRGNWFDSTVCGGIPAIYFDLKSPIFLNRIWAII